MYRDKERWKQDPTTVLRSKSNFRDPLSWDEPRLIFTCSWSDWFIEEADTWRPEAWEIIKRTPHHTYQILTKRPERIGECLPPDWREGYANVWLGVSVENQKTANLRIPQLLGIPSSTRFLSIEPLVGPISFRDKDLFFHTWDWDLFDWKEIDMRGIDWVIIGGESGNESGSYRYRPCNIKWIQKIISECREGGVSVFVKQLGTHLARELKLTDRHGGKIEEWPEELRIREMPKPVLT